METASDCAFRALRMLATKMGSGLNCSCPTPIGKGLRPKRVQLLQHPFDFMGSSDRINDVASEPPRQLELDFPAPKADDPHNWIFILAGAGGFEPPNDGTKNRLVMVWPHPSFPRPAEICGSRSLADIVFRWKKNPSGNPGGFSLTGSCSVSFARQSAGDRAQPI